MKARASDDDDDDENDVNRGSQQRLNFPPVNFSSCVSPVKDGGWRLDEPFGELLLLVGCCLVSSGEQSTL